MAKILLVDDSNTLLKLFKRMLIDGGHDVIATSSGRLAIEHLTTAPVDLVLTDLYMPDMDGFDIVNAVRELPEPPPLVVMSSNGQACNVFRDARAFGASAVLQKPFSAEQLLSTVGSVLAGAAPRLAPTPETSSEIAPSIEAAVPQFI